MSQFNVCRNVSTSTAKAPPVALSAIAVLTMFTAGVVFAQPQPAADAPQGDDDRNQHLWQPRTRSVAVFKNGLGFFMRQGDVTLREGWCVAEHVPPAAFGTLAIYATDEKETVDIVGSGPGEVVAFDDRDAADDLPTRRSRLEACRNLKIELSYKHEGQDRKAAGRLASVGPKYVVLDSGSNSFAVPVAEVERLQVLELPLRVHVESEAAKQPEKSTLGMAYLRKGIIWIPDYTLKVIDDDTAELTLRGTLINEAEDLIHTDVHLVVGVPHFVHTDYLAPLAVGQVIRAIGAAMPGAVGGQMLVNNYSNIVTVQNTEGVIVERSVDAGGDLGNAMGNLPQLGGAAATDYTVYTKENMTLRRGEKAIVTLFTRKITYSHIYRWSPPGRMTHSLVLQNSTDTAWTTGPCLAVSAGRPLSEDLIRYTPKGSNGELPVTAAINVAHDRTEREIERKLKAHSPSNNVHLDLVQLEGTLSIRNFEKDTVKLVIRNPVPGKPVSAEQDGVISVDSSKLILRERAGAIRWEVTLDPDEKKTLTYEYERYVPSN